MRRKCEYGVFQIPYSHFRSHSIHIEENYKNSWNCSKMTVCSLLNTAIVKKLLNNEWSMYSLYNDLTIFSKKWLKSGLLQFLTMWILWDRKCEYWFFHITHAKNSSNHLSLTRDLTIFLAFVIWKKPYSHLLLTVFSQSVLIWIKSKWKWLVKH